MPGLCLEIAYVYNSQSSCELVGQTASFNATRVLLGHASPTIVLHFSSSCLDCEFLNCFFQGSYFTIIGEVCSLFSVFVYDCWNPSLCFSHPSPENWGENSPPLPFIEGWGSPGCWLSQRWSHLMSGTTCHLSQPYPGGRGGGGVCGRRVIK